MKKLYTLLTLILISSLSFGQTFYTENMGTPSGTTAIAANIFQNTSVTYSGSGDVRATSVSSGYTGFSAAGNVFLTSTLGKYFQISGLNTSSYLTADLQLSFGYVTSSILTQLVVEKSTDGTTWTPLTFTNNTNTAWNLITIAGGQIPSSATLSLRFTQPATAQMRIDDVKLSNVPSSCSLALGTPVAVCNLFTLGNDTYTVTIPYTGGGSATYTTVPASGTVGGDNPSTVATGNITISGISEGTNFSATVTGGTCSLSSSLNSPECKPINPLPYTEHFNYTVGNSLGTEQTWTNVNTGDNVLAVTGNLAYTGITSSGNSISFSGAGIEAFTPFTSTTSGTVYYSFLMNITDMSNVTVDLTETYFAGLTDSGKNYMGRLFVKKNGTQYQLGFDSAPTTTNYDPTLRNVGDVVLVVMAYDFTANKLSAWLNPDLTTFTTATPATLVNTPATAIAGLGGLILRQDTATTTPTITIDELKISTTFPSLSIKQNSIAGLSIYPNPVTNGTLYITSNSSNAKTVAVYDILGKQVLNAKTSNNTVNVSSLKGGAYILQISEDGKTDTRKLIIQ
jgi:hypothetical protein